LAQIKELGYDFVDEIYDFVKVTPLSDTELKDYHSLLLSIDLGKGELQCIVICMSRICPFLTNDKKAKNFAREKGIKTWDIPDLLKAIWKAGIKRREEVRILIDLLEMKDYMVPYSVPFECLKHRFSHAS
jgi:predicted nucleic acid-binding protein